MIKIYDKNTIQFGKSEILSNKLYENNKWLLCYNLRYCTTDDIISIIYGDDIPIGCLFLQCSFKRDRTLKYRHFFLHTYIRPEYRNNGLGIQLITETIKIISIEYKITKLTYQEGINGSLNFYNKIIQGIKL